MPIFHIQIFSYYFGKYKNNSNGYIITVEGGKNAVNNYNIEMTLTGLLSVIKSIKVFF